jgi:PIN domain nuclease of toxin-antitoxin system
MTRLAWVHTPSELSSYGGPLLLDTHIWVWYLEGDTTQLTPEVIQLLDRGGAGGGLRVSDISYWEVAVKTAKGKLAFSVDPTVWLNRAAKAPGIRSLPLDREVLLLSTRLPGTVPNDPADRMLIAAALLNSLPLVTADSLIIDYVAAYPGPPVVDARVQIEDSHQRPLAVDNHGLDTTLVSNLR